jgi:hypothetical protein
MRQQYLHLSAYACARCNGPVVAGSLATRENEISKETDIRHVGAICLTCGHRQSKETGGVCHSRFSAGSMGANEGQPHFARFRRMVNRVP